MLARDGLRLFSKVRFESLECNGKRWLLKHRYSGNTPIPEKASGTEAFCGVYIVSHSTRPSNYAKFVDSKLCLFPYLSLLSPGLSVSLSLSVPSRNGSSQNSLLLRSRSKDDIWNRSIRFVFGAFACKAHFVSCNSKVKFKPLREVRI